MGMVSTQHEFCPAKVNLQLAVLGQRPDGFHNLLSVVAQLDWGDELEVRWEAQGEDAGVANGPQDRVEFSLEGSAEALELPPPDNTVTVAIRALRQACSLFSGRFHVRVKKRIPSGAGLGGASSNAVGFLRAAQRLLGERAAMVNLRQLAAHVGSDCPLFLEPSPVILAGRGNQLEKVPVDLAQRLRGQPVLLYKPDFGIATPAAYLRLRAQAAYTPELTIEQLLQRWRMSANGLPPAGNDFERILPGWIPSLALVLKELRAAGCDARLSGSGSTLMVLPGSRALAPDVIEAVLQNAWGNCYSRFQARLK